MTDSFLHPDGHRYRCIGTQKDGDPTRTDLWVETGFGEMVPLNMESPFSSGLVLFERVEPPLWPWTGLSGCDYWIEDGRLRHTFTNAKEEDFAGLGERLVKQAKLGGDA